jgi:hypothetical protein
MQRGSLILAAIFSSNPHFPVIHGVGSRVTVQPVRRHETPPGKGVNHEC